MVAFDPMYEDCLRLILVAMRRENVSLDDASYIEHAMNAYTENPAHLIQTDKDRSFHLVARAAEAADYRSPYLTDENEAEALEAEVLGYLREAVELDDTNWDARRMLAELETDSNDAFVSYLLDNRQAVERQMLDAVARTDDAYGREFARDLAHRPYLRWLATLSSRSLIAGQYRLALQVAEESLAHTPVDPAGVRHTAMLAMAKLEFSEDKLRRFRRRNLLAYGPQNLLYRRHHVPEKNLDPWTLLAQTNIAYRCFDYERANRSLRLLLRLCKHAAQILCYQVEFPEGLFGRVNVIPGSEDELILAVSEATPLFQEGLGAPDAAGFSAWISENKLVQAALKPALSNLMRKGELPQSNGNN